MTDKVVQDVKGTVAFLLGEMRDGLLAGSRKLSPEELVDHAITSTLGIIERQFELTSQVACTPEGLPVVINGLVDEYWAMVNDEGD